MLFVIDFDGTVAPTDTVDELLERFADPKWRTVEQQWVEGLINSQECMAAQLAMVSAERPVLEEFFQSVAIDPAFPDFVRFANTFADLAIVSDGLDYPIRYALQKLDLPPISIYANRLGFRTGGLEISFPYTDAACMVKSGVCKCAVSRSVDDGRELTTVLIGDGRSDRCIARQARFVFAKGSLLTFCREENISHMPFDSFADITAVIRGWNIRPPERLFKERSCPLLRP